MSTDFKVIVELVGKCKSPPGEGIPSGVSFSDICIVENRLGFEFPKIYRNWLSTCNGPCVGPGALVGIMKKRKIQNIESIPDLHPTWKEKRWIPVASDGCGNYYLLTKCGYQEPVVFVDVSKNSHLPEYICSSSLLKFLYFYLGSEISKSPWPFDREYVLGLDPDIAQYTEYLLPWEL